jgi:hypothetical protein
MHRSREDLIVRSLPIEVECYELDDRVGHAVYVLLSDDRRVLVMTSVEGDSSQADPPSGVMQEIVSEAACVGKAPVLMGLGSAGKSTWSCSIEADATIESVAFDFACKSRSAKWLGSTYRIEPGVEVRQESDVILLKVDSVELCVRSFGEVQLRYGPMGRIVTFVAPNPVDNANAKGQYRWRYVVGLRSSLILASDSANI